MTETAQIFGAVTEQFTGVAAQFRRNFTERGDLGASVYVIHDGEPVVDLWGGFADTARTQRWNRETVTVVFSCTKGATALCAHILAARGELELDRPVGYYWPEFGGNGKTEITTRMLLNHQAGLPGVSRTITVEEAHDPIRMAQLLAGEGPTWEPGTRYGYHALTFGWLTGEVVRRVSGATLGAFFASEVAGPLDLDFWIGLPEAEERRVASVVPADADGDEVSPGFSRALQREEPIQVAAFNSFARTASLTDLCASREARRIEMPAANGVTNGRGLARMYAPLSHGGIYDGVALVDEEQITEMMTVESSAFAECVLFDPMRHSAGFQKATPGTCGNDEVRLTISEAAFGHEGLGGSVAFADPEARLAFGYVTNQHAVSGWRGRALIDATYSALGYRRTRGRWRPDGTQATSG